MEENLKLKIVSPLGVSAAIPVTYMLAEVAFKLGKKKVLDMGTGTGYIAIYLAKRGAASVDATDISDLALATARENAERNNVTINIYKSDFFEKVTGKFDLIVWNAPVGDSRGSRPADFIKSVIRGTPILYKISQKLSYRLFLSERLQMDKKVLREAINFLVPGGVLAMILIDGEKEGLELLAGELGYNTEIIETTEFMQHIPGCIAIFTKNL